ncbi:putative membrane protein [Natranaeroarchaeum sulfidigenes]|uniref:Putative membrane protein n=2 Tax=Natranaeroarchaeum sulfidigenes TaxID=2784880 RepID=A0A897MRE4_9EURY|nr:hypothetical protein [Natranaeroarchaeum sulfidigenes]QSG03124.1 putative membrane protein [Natranaeroarchaeum sulfidigenes]
MSEYVVATVVTLLVTLSFPLYLYGAWIIIQEEVVTWNLLIRHLKYVTAGLVLTTVPMLVWMVPNAFNQFSPLLAVHMFFGLQAYALLLVALTGIVRIFQVKRQHNLYHDTSGDVDIGELHENMGAWRWRLRIGVFGYVGCWIIAYLIGLFRFVLRFTFLW